MRVYRNYIHLVLISHVSNSLMEGPENFTERGAARGRPSFCDYLFRFTSSWSKLSVVVIILEFA